MNYEVKIYKIYTVIGSEKGRSNKRKLNPQYIHPD